VLIRLIDKCELSSVPVCLGSGDTMTSNLNAAFGFIVGLALLGIGPCEGDLEVLIPEDYKVDKGGQWREIARYAHVPAVRELPSNNLSALTPSSVLCLLCSCRQLRMRC